MCLGLMIIFVDLHDLSLVEPEYMAHNTKLGFYFVGFLSPLDSITWFDPNTANKSHAGFRLKTRVCSSYYYS